MSKGFHKAAENLWYFFIYKFLYVTGLTFLIPAVAVIAAGRAYSQVSTYLAIAFFLILISFIGMMARKGNLGMTLKSMGKITIIPGAIAVLIYIFGDSILFLFISILPFSESISFLARAYIDLSVPQMGIFVFAYLAIGITLYFLGLKAGK